MKDKVIQFLRKRDYIFLKELGAGACGKTVLLHDDMIDQDFVCKKFAPCVEEGRPELFSSFVREVKLLHQIYHENVVRVFNYYLYPSQFMGYILMEYVEGLDIEDYLSKNPEMINELFIQTVAGFRYLESHNILHRDIRPQNIMVHIDGTVKIIDFGFGKRVLKSQDFDKSISLNWWCEPPNEFSVGLYDFRSEVYFVGKLFEKIIQYNGIDQFKYKALLFRMCDHDADKRIQTFADVEKDIQGSRFYEIGFSKEEIETYRDFANEIDNHITKIENNAKYLEDIERAQIALENAYRTFMLEETVPDSTVVLQCILQGAYYYRKKGFRVEVVRAFVHLLKSSSPEKKRIIFSNLHTRMDSVTRYEETAVELEPF
jgi:hypothetical protein